MYKKENYVTKEVPDLNIENVSTKIDSKFELLNNKFDQVPMIIELALRKQSEKQCKQKNELIKWFIGTFIAAAAFIIVYLSMG